MQDDSAKIKEEEKLDGTSYKKNLETLVDIITDVNIEQDLRVKILQILRSLYFKCPSTAETHIIHSANINTLFDILISVEKNNQRSDDVMLEKSKKYFLLLISYLKDYHKALETELISFIELLKGKKRLNSNFIEEIWMKFESENLIWPDTINIITEDSTGFLEVVVLNWIESVHSNINHKNVKFFAAASAQCAQLFQTLSRMLNQFVIITKGNVDVLHLVESYISYVNEYCDEKSMCVLKLYPRSCWKLVSLLLIPPKAFLTVFEKSTLKGTKNYILDLLLESFNINHSMTLMLLTHYPEWLKEFVNIL